MERATGRWGRFWMKMVWHDLLFAHWPVSEADAARLQAGLPEGVGLDRYDGVAYLGVVPFGMRGIGLRGLPAWGPLSTFPEINLRTYVRVKGRRGVWFYSLDAASWTGVRMARSAFCLPYFNAVMAMSQQEDGWIAYRSERVKGERWGGPGALFEGRYRGVPGSTAETSEAGSLEAFLTERYSLFTQASWGPWKGRVLRADIRHEPWRLRLAEAEISTNDMARLVGMDLGTQPPLLHVGDRLGVQATRVRVAG
ncbi:MAG: DUF2071 domain-containing protein [Planctomycetota bacterium]